MTKEDKQIIKRAVKENWRIGDRSRLKRLLKKNLEQYRDNVELEQENRLLGERCNQLLKDKGNLTDELQELKETLAQTIENDEVAYETLKLHDQEEIGMLNSKVTELEQQIEKMKEKHKQEILDLVLSSSSERAKLESDFRICEKNADTYYDQRTKAIELLKQWVELYKPKLEGYPITPIQEQTEQFIKEIEK